MSDARTSDCIGHGHGHGHGHDHGSAHDEHHEASPLEVAMEGLQSGQRRLRKLLETPESRDACLELVRAMQQSALAAFGNPPAPPEGEGLTPLAWEVGFRRQVLALLDQLLVLEQAVGEGRVEDAKASYGELSRLKNEGHDRYQREH